MSSASPLGDTTAREGDDGDGRPKATVDVCSVRQDGRRASARDIFTGGPSWTGVSCDDRSMTPGINPSWWISEIPSAPSPSGHLPLELTSGESLNKRR
jgi:hypothetical protein